MTPALLRRFVEKWGDKGPVIALRAAAGWQGGDRLRLSDGEADVAECRSPLEVREQLALHADGDGRLVILTAVEENELGDDVLARLAGRTVHSVKPWDLVRDAFALRRIDARLDQHPWLAIALLERTPPGGHLPLSTGVLDRETAWRMVLDAWFGIKSARPDALALLRWSIEEGSVARYAAAPEDLRGGLRDWVGETAGPVGRIVVESLAKGAGCDALPLGVACSVVFAAGDEAAVARAQAAVRLERYTGGNPLTADVGQQFAEVARQAVLEQLALGGLKAALPFLDRADAIVADIGASDAAHLSGLARCGFEARLARYGAQCQAAIAGGAGAELAEAGRAVSEHVLAAHDLDRADRVAMATRLCRWLHNEAAAREAGSLADAALRYARDGGFVDWARAALRGGEPAPQLSAAYEQLGAAVGAATERQNRRFGQLLAGWVASGGEGEALLPIEQVLSRVVAPLAAEVPVLLAVLDGMSASVASELLEDLVRRGWLPLRQPGLARASACPSAVPMVAAFPTVTEICRASLLCGTLTQGVSGDEKRGFAAALRPVSGARHPPALFHKGELVDAASGALAAEVRAAIAAPERRVVGVVLNAVDDYLSRSDQVRIRWTLDSLPLLQALLHEAQAAGRIVVLTSDHGHVLERDSTMRRADLGDRYRSVDGTAQADEVLLRGARVLSPGNAIIAPWSEQVRFSNKKNGYHGGAAPAEVIVPLAVLTPAGGETAGWEEAGFDHPSWWDEVLEAPSAAPQPARRTPRGKPQGELFASRPVATPDWIAGLLRSPLLADRKERAGRRGVPDDRLQAVLAALAARDGRMPLVALAQQLGVAPLRLNGILAGVRELLNVDGYPVLTVDGATDSVDLNRELLFVQFDLG